MVQWLSNVNKTFVYLTAQIRHMKNYGNISSIFATWVRPYKRHYNSALSIWLSVDPLADKYPGVSPYVYCANNPVRLVDADGRNIWELDECGNIINHIEDDMVDQFRIVDDKGKKAISIHETKGIQNIIKIHTISH